jgi:hypothetical protein
MKRLEIKNACISVTGFCFEVWQFWDYIFSIDSVFPTRMTTLNDEMFVQW